jgi:hypothetical protein
MVRYIYTMPKYTDLKLICYVELTDTLLELQELLEHKRAFQTPI